jgi:predicted RNA-binding Zn-ribbon protein involved in translation (DUF1610 family)
MNECHKIKILDSDYIIGQYYMNLKNPVDNLCNIIKILEMSLFQIIETIKSKNIRSCDPVLISQIIKFKLNKLFKEFECPDCGSQMNHNKFISRSLKTTFGTINIKYSYCFFLKCKSYFELYAKVLNIRPGAYQYDRQKIL